MTKVKECALCGDTIPESGRRYHLCKRMMYECKPSMWAAAEAYDIEVCKECYDAIRVYPEGESNE